MNRIAAGAKGTKPNLLSSKTSSTSYYILTFSFIQYHVYIYQYLPRRGLFISTYFNIINSEAFNHILYGGLYVKRNAVKYLLRKVLKQSTAKYFLFYNQDWSRLVKPFILVLFNTNQSCFGKSGFGVWRSLRQKNCSEVLVTKITQTKYCEVLLFYPGLVQAIYSWYDQSWAILFWKVWFWGMAVFTSKESQ